VSDERREHPRFACEVDAWIALPEGRRLESRSIDLSFAGVCLLADEGVKPGTTIDVALQLRFEWARSDELVLTATVVWSTPTRGRFQIGARFDPDMESLTWTKLDVLLQALSGDLDLGEHPL
jgi:hypothetical protein